MAASAFKWIKSMDSAVQINGIYVDVFEKKLDQMASKHNPVKLHRNQILELNEMFTISDRDERKRLVREWAFPKALMIRKEYKIAVEKFRIILLWKMIRGKYRHFLLSLIDKNTPKDYYELFCDLKIVMDGLEEESLKENIEKREEFLLNTLRIMSSGGSKKLKGVGPATGSAILSIIDFDFPFFSDESGLCLLGNVSLKYNFREFQEIHSKLALEARNNDLLFNKQELERAIWIYYQKSE